MKVNTRKLTRRQRDDLVGYWFVAPLIIGVAVILIPVLALSVQFSFHQVIMGDGQFEMHPVGWENYKTILMVNPYFVRNMITSISSLALTIPAVVIFSLFIAVLLNQELPGRGVFRVILFIPVILGAGYFGTTLTNDVLTASLNDMQSFDTGVSGAVGYFTAERISAYLMELNISTSVTDLLVSLLNGIPTIIQKSGVQILVFLAGLQGISSSVYEAAQIEGATAWESFWKITVPLISPMILVNLLYTIIDSFTGASNSIMTAIQETSFRSFKFGEGAAMAWVYFSVIMVIIALVYLLAHHFVFYEERR